MSKIVKDFKDILTIVVILKPSLMSFHFNAANENQVCPFIFYYTVIHKETIEFLMPPGPNEENIIKKRERERSR